MNDPLIESFERLAGDRGIDVFSFISSQGDLSTEDQLKLLLVDQQRRWAAGNRLNVESYLDRLPQLAADRSGVLALAEAEFATRLRSGENPPIEDFLLRFPEISEELRLRLQAKSPAGKVKDHSLLTKTVTPDAVQLQILAGRYRKVRVLGEGAFGVVTLCFDEELQRLVAIKIPTAERFQRSQDAELFLTEARTVASLNHPNIVPVYDLGRTPDGAVFVVSRFIDGCTLKDQLRSGQMTATESARLIQTIATALQEAHNHRVIHRDVKPDNILIEGITKTPFITDFGLAIREEDYAKQTGIAGTPAYMSPEQARGEGHRLDCRSDVFSLGAILYEMMTGQRPFRGSTPNEVLHQVVSVDPAPPRSIRENVAEELERICLKAMRKQASDRYRSAAELADDLEAWLSPASHASAATKVDVAVVPKGLRSFDGGDADFFLDLLPGTRNREGLPESVAFWKQRLEQIDSEKTFALGLIYGPSGCGKSSLVKAGLLPHLSDDLIAVFVEATPDETEQRILRGLRKRLPNLHTDLGLIDTLAAVRRETGPKVVIIIDQFEQWLHTHRAEAECELVQALRHCDGGRLQAVVMIRDDFAMAAARFMDALDIPILQGVNFATVDLFEVRHAAKVLTKFGRAFQQLPSGKEALTEEQEQFVAAVAEGLAQDGKVVSVRLALFAEMIKNKPWTKKTLRDVGGTEGIGVNFLEETFGSRTANPKHRQHQAAARAVLKTLLPEVGTDIKGHMRSHLDLLEISGYRDRLSGFNDLLRILDGELRLITPTDPEGDTLSGSSRDSSLAIRFYQLTHDYLVPSLREWLTRKQKETRKGRAELKLEERSSLWTARPENRSLPSLPELLSIWTLTESRHWTAPQRLLMLRAARMHGIQWGSLLLVLLLVGMGIQRWVAAEREVTVRKELQTSADAFQNNPGASVPLNLAKLKTYPGGLVLSELKTRFAAVHDVKQKLLLAYGLAAYGQLEAEYLTSQIDAVSESDVRNFMEALKANAAMSIASLKVKARECNKSLWHRKAKLAIAALELGDDSLACDMCTIERRPDPEQRTLFIDEFHFWRVDAIAVLVAVKDSDSPALRSGICLGMGQIGDDAITANEKDSWIPLLSHWFSEMPDKSTHSASGWLLRRWAVDEPLNAILVKEKSAKEWFINSAGITMLRLSSGRYERPQTEFRESEDEPLDVSDFWISDREVTVEQYHLFLDDLEYAVIEKPKKISGNDRERSLSKFHPAQEVSWYDAILFCNWLSKRSGLKPFYERSGQMEEGADPRLGSPLTEAWRSVSGANGYRLPTALEWKYMCRAGTTTSTFSGNDMAHFTGYCQFFPSVGPSICGIKMPNSWGVCDSLGNVEEWTSDAYSEGKFRILIGADYASSFDRIANLRGGGAHPASRSTQWGFRIAIGTDFERQSGPVSK